MTRCKDCKMKEDGYVICRRPVVWKDKDGEKHLILCGLERVLKDNNYPEEGSDTFNKIVALIQVLSKLKK
jgi:hypothetical protein